MFVAAAHSPSACVGFMVPSFRICTLYLPWKPAKSKGETGIEPVTIRSAVERSTTELLTLEL